MTLSAITLLVIGLAFVAYIAARSRAAAFAAPGRATSREIGQVHSRPNQHGWFVALFALIPALLLVAGWSIVDQSVIDARALESVPVAQRPTSDLDRQAFLNEVRGVATGELQAAFDPNAERAAVVWRSARDSYNLAVLGLALTLALAGGAYAFTRVRPDFRARPRVERFVMGLLVLASLVAIATTIGIVGSLLFESWRFFSMVSPVEFLTGTVWSPQTAIRADQVGSSGAFGAVPLFWGTIFIGAIIAMIVAIPLGLMSAIYLTQYARPNTRRTMKPLLELLAGVPTVVYGYFAALTVAPAVRDFALSIGIESASSESALAAGLVMGIMIIPFVSSMADDSINAVPQAMRDGSLAMGATTSETIRRVLIPAALPGIVGGVLLAVSRAIGETMIVVMAAGLAANLTVNPFESVTTVTTQIVQLLTGDQEFDSAKTLSAFALGLVLFVVTLILNIYALRVVKRYREAYE
jgi:phosphate transport system permease protein